VPDRVIDAPIPSEEREDLRQTLAKAVDRHVMDESLRELVNIAANGIYWRDKRIDELESTIARLEAEKQAAHTEGWNACVKAVVERMEGLASSMWGVPRETTDWLCKMVRELSKPTAAKPEPSPSSANRAEGRQG
jgi:hypothetical protein